VVVRDPSRWQPRRWLTAAVTERLPYKAAALFLALVLWLVVSAEEPTEDLVPVRVALLLDSSLTLVSPRPVVQALVVGRGRELLKLYATPPVIRRVLPADVDDSVQFDLRPVDVDLPEGIDAIVRDVQPRTIALRFSATAERRFPVRSALTVRAADGVRVTGTPSFSPESVTVVGPRRALRIFDNVWTVRETVTVADSMPHTARIDTTRVRGRVRPTRVTYTVPVEAVEPPDTLPPPDSLPPASHTTRPRAGRASPAPRP
jgi:hypothetical protein